MNPKLMSQSEAKAVQRIAAASAEETEVPPGLSRLAYAYGLDYYELRRAFLASGMGGVLESIDARIAEIQAARRVVEALAIAEEECEL